MQNGKTIAIVATHPHTHTIVINGVNYEMHHTYTHMHIFKNLIFVLSTFQNPLLMTVRDYCV